MAVTAATAVVILVAIRGVTLGAAVTISKTIPTALKQSVI